MKASPKAARPVLRWLKGLQDVDDNVRQTTARVRTHLYHIHCKYGGGMFHITKQPLCMFVNIITPRTHLPHRPPEPSEHSNQRTASSLQRTHRQFTSTRLHPRGGAAASVKRGNSAYTGARACRTSVRSSFSSTHLHTKPPKATYPPASPQVDDIHTHILAPFLKCSMGEAFPGARRFMRTLATCRRIHSERIVLRFNAPRSFRCMRDALAHIDRPIALAQGSTKTRRWGQNRVQRRESESLGCAC
jgi:hypothetical protein